MVMRVRFAARVAFARVLPPICPLEFRLWRPHTIPARRDPEDEGPEVAVNLRIEEPELEASGLN
jgi:hypothetical protein